MKKIVIIYILILIIFIPGCINKDNDNSNTNPSSDNQGYYEIEIKISQPDNYKIIIPFLDSDESNILNNISASSGEIIANIVENNEKEITFNNRGLEIQFSSSFSLNYSVIEPWSLSLRESVYERDGNFWFFVSSEMNNSVLIRLWAYDDTGTSYETYYNGASFISLNLGWNVIKLNVSTDED